MSISIETLSTPLQSYSRTGRMAEAFRRGGRAVQLPEHRSRKLDLSKLLSIADLDDAPAEDAAAAAVGGGSGELCSSAREHPSVGQKAVYVATAEKEIAFARAMRELVADDALRELGGPRHDKGSAAALAAVHRGDDSATGHPATVDERMKALRAQLRRQEQQSRPKVRPSPCFRAVGRAAAREAETDSSSSRKRKVGAAAPPVGHYHPRFDIVEQPLHRNVYFPKASRNLGSGCGREEEDIASTRRRRGSDKDEGDALADTLNKTTVSQQSHGLLSATTNSKVAAPPLHSPQPASISQNVRLGAAVPSPAPAAPAVAAGGVSISVRSASAMDRPTWPFLSRDSHMTPLRLPKRAGTSLGPHEAIVNRDLVENRKDTLKAFNMGKLVGREKAQAVRSHNSLDLFYNPKLPPFHAPALLFDRQVPRFKSVSLPRTSREVETLPSRVDLSKFDKFKFSRQAMLCDIKKHTSRDATTNNVLLEKMKSSVGASELQDAPVYVPPFKTPVPNMRTVTGRKEQKPRPASDVVYEVSYSQLDKHWPDTKITATPNRPLPGQKLCETVQISVGAYRSDTPLVHKKLTADIDLSRMVSREKRERVTAVGLSGGRSVTESYDVSYSAMERHVSGFPIMTTQMSREKRMRVQSPAPEVVDKVYSYSTETMHAPLKKGAVEFEKQVVREKHTGTFFANASKAMLNPDRGGEVAGSVASPSRHRGRGRSPSRVSS